jgi:predicted dehydrogenase/threonine dehydrogenase-like Zn-dependent dehydrogenase
MEVVENIKKNGFGRTIHKIKSKVEEGAVTGYSAAGIVLEVGKNIKDVAVGARVACAGAGIANHAEYIEVPRNLLVKVPEGVDFTEASTVTLGAIALQGVRRSDPKLGEFVAVLGLGILGQITVQLLKANGSRVIGTDLDEKRVEKALELGMDHGVNPSAEDAVKSVVGFSHGNGVDTAIITTASNSNEPLVQAFRMCRKKGKVVLVGVVDMHFNREEMYRKELDLLISTSYGPGRYDEGYERKGLLYPYAYVRWTETRNMEEYLRLMAEKKINIKALIGKEYAIEKAPEAYESLSVPASKPLIVLLKYGQQQEVQISRRIDVTPQPTKQQGVINIAVIGAGGFAKEVHLPNLMKLKHLYRLYAIASKTGNNAKAMVQRFGAVYATTDYQEVLRDKNIDAVIITTRHNLHAKIAMEALRAGKAVFLEKPMAMNQEELDALVNAIEETKLPFTVGFNRRFSLYAQEIKKHISQRINPMIINYRMNAGYLPPDHWVYSEEGGGRIIGEACHIFDLFEFFTDSEVESISVDRMSPRTNQYSSEDNAIITLKYKDGSVCSLTYTTLGNNAYHKEYCEIYFDGKIIVMDDYKELRGMDIRVAKIKTDYPNKGLFEELVEFSSCMNGKMPIPIPLRQLQDATEISLKLSVGL